MSQRYDQAPMSHLCNPAHRAHGSMSGANCAEVHAMACSRSVMIMPMLVLLQHRDRTHQKCQAADGAGGSCQIVLPCVGHDASQREGERRPQGGVVKRWLWGLL